MFLKWNETNSAFENDDDGVAAAAGAIQLHRHRHLYQKHPHQLYKWLNAYKFKFISKWNTNAMQIIMPAEW